MRVRPLFWSVVCLLCLAGAWFFWQQGNRWSAERATGNPTATATNAVSNLPAGSKLSGTNAVQSAATNAFPYRLSNTRQVIGKLAGDRRAILLENALIDTRQPLDFSIPKKLQAAGDPGAYIVQARGELNAGFRALLTSSGAVIVSYIPNNAYLVRMDSGAAGGLSANGLVAAVIPYEPYYKVQSALLAHTEESLPKGNELNLGLFSGNAAQTISAIEALGGQVLAQSTSPFGPVVQVTPPKDWTTLARLPGVQIVELAYHKRAANDLTRARTQVAADTQVATNYLGLTGSNVWVMVDDSGIDASHPDLSGRVFGAFTNDTIGHGTHVAGIIAGNGAESTTVTNAQGSILTNTPAPRASSFQFRGMAPLTKLVALDSDLSDRTLQETAAQTNALISNNSWGYTGDNQYDLNAASYDAAVRDALPLVTGSQPVLFVFAAGNSGGGNNGGGGGNADTILSPATAKNVITVGALELARNITNTVTNADNSVTQPWKEQSDTSFQVSGFSSRGNVGIGTEGTYGRYKPDVIAPGTFVVSTRSSMWATNVYFNPTNHAVNTYQNQVIQTNDLNYYSISIPPNAVGVNIYILANSNSPNVFPDLPIYVQQSNYPDPVDDPTSIDIITTNNLVSIPDPDGGDAYLTSIRNDGFYYAVGNSTNIPVSYNLITEILTTNNLGTYYEALHNLDDKLCEPPYHYRYESGTSMSAPVVSGLLALMQDYFTNTLHLTPSPALLKALLINGARSVGNYDFQTANSINFQGWGLPNLPTSIQPGMTNSPGAASAMFFADQSPTNALATGDSRTYHLTITNSDATYVPLRVTLAWTDPAGNPAAAFKLVNNLDLVVTNLDDPTNPVVYVGNDISSSSIYNSPWDTNNSPAPNWDNVNNIENVYLSPLLGTNYTVTVIARSVNVNAVTAHTNDYVQDYALVVSSGDGEVTNAFTISAVDAVSNLAPNITFVLTNDVPLLNQYAGANTPLLGTNDFNPAGATNKQVTIGMTNQWHFYVVTNTEGFTNAAFITFIPATASLPRMGVFTGSDDDSTRPEADIDLFVTTDPGLTNLAIATVSNCVAGAQVSATTAGVLYAASYGRGGTEFVADTNSALNQVYYIGVKSEDHEAAEYGFLPVFSDQPFSQLNPDGSQTINGLRLPVNIPDGTPAHPGVAYTFALALYPMEVGNVIVTNGFTHQNFGDLVGVLNHNGETVVLNNHRSLDNPPGPYSFVYDDETYPITGSQTSDGPGSLRTFVSEEAIGPWMLVQVDNALTQTGRVDNFTLRVQPHQDPLDGLQVTLQPESWFFTFVEVPPAATNLTVYLTNLTTVPGPIQMYIRYGEEPDFTNYDKMITVSNGVPLWNGSISIGRGDVPPLRPGRYYIGLYNPNITSQDVYLKATLDYGASEPLDLASTGVTPILDDAVTYSYINVTNTDLIYSLNVGLRVDHPRISDLVFHLISPDGARYLLMENRGGTSTNGAGVTIVTTNNYPTQSYDGSAAAVTNVIDTQRTSGRLTIDYDFQTLPDQMTVYQGSTLVFDSGMISSNGTFNISYGPGSTTLLTIIMNEFGNTNSMTKWGYTIQGIQTNYYYLTFTEDTNLTTVPIKYAPPPFVPNLTTNYTNIWANGFEESTLNATVYSNDYFSGGWHVDSGSIDITPTGTFGSTAYEGNWYIDLDGSSSGSISTNIVTIPNQKYVLSFAYARNPDSITGALGHPPNVPQANVLINSNSIGGIVADYTNTWINLDWRVISFAFTANSTSTVLKLASLDVPDNISGVLLDGFTIKPYAEISNLYYLPEESFSDVKGKRALGTWTLEIWDNRVGATNNANLVSWDLDFTFATARPINFDLEDGAPLNNFIGAGGIAYYRITVPTNATSATNILINASGSLNLYWTTNAPPSITNANDVYLFGGTSDSAVLTTNSAPPLIPGGTYYIAIENTNSVTVSYTLEVDFNSTIFPPVLPNQPPVSVNELSTLTVTNAATNLYGNAMTYTVSGPSNAVIDASGIITWTPTEAEGPGVYSIQTIVTDTVTLLTATNIFNVMVLEVNNFAPVFNYPVDGLVTNIDANVLFTLTNSATDADIPPNAISYSLLNPPSGLAIDTNGVITWTPSTAQAGTTNVIVTVATDDGVPPLSTTNTFTLIVNPVLVTNANGLAMTLLATAVTGTNATLNGFASPNGDASTAWFEWGLTRYYGNQTPAVNIGNGTGVVYLTNLITGLLTNEIYHYRLAVSNETGIAYGFDQMLGVGKVLAWGWNAYGQTNVPPDLTNAVMVSGTYGASLVLKSDGMVTMWGNNSLGETNVPAGLSNVIQIASGYAHSLALKADHTVVAWGWNAYGQTNVPAGLSDVVAVAGGAYQSLALKRDGTVVAWGGTGLGQTNVPLNLTNAVAVSGEIDSSCGLRIDGTVVIWGYITPVETNVPPAATNIVMISSSGDLQVALRKDGVPIAWGTSGSGVDNVPANLTNAVATTVGYDHFAMALKDDYTPVAWGDNAYGQTNIPVNFTNLFAIGAGGRHGLFIQSALPHSLTLPAPNVTVTTTNVTLSWNAPLYEAFQVQWATNLPPAWNTFTNILTSTNGVFTFVDDGSQSGGLGGMRFYRLILLP